MVVTCSSCNESLAMPFTCTYCKNKFCEKHRLAENHDCIKTKYTKYIRKDWLRKRGVNISTGMYVVKCDTCGYLSENPSLIEEAGEELKKHLDSVGCPTDKVFLDEPTKYVGE